MRVAGTAASVQLGGEIIKAAIDSVGNDNVVGFARTSSKATHLGVEVGDGDYKILSELPFLAAVFTAAPSQIGVSTVDVNFAARNG